MPTAFITGVTGQDGGYLLERLLVDEYEVHGLVQAGDPTVGALVARGLPVTLHTGDLTDEQRISDLIAELGPTEIYNLAGISSVAFSWEKPVLTGEVTGVAVASLLEAAWRLQGKLGEPVHFVQASSAEIFGNAAVSPQNEQTPLRPTSPYGAAKAYAHHLVGVYRERGLASSTCILYNHESPRRPTTFVTRKITNTVAQISLGLADELVLGNLDARRDWGWAPDYVDGLVRAARHPMADDYVIATGVAHTVADFVAAAFARVGITEWQPYVRTDPAFVRPVDAVEQLGDASKARQVLGWAPTVDFIGLVAAMVDADLAELANS